MPKHRPRSEGAAQRSWPQRSVQLLYWVRSATTRSRIVNPLRTRRSFRSAHQVRSVRSSPIREQGGSLTGFALCLPTMSGIALGRMGCPSRTGRIGIIPSHRIRKRPVSSGTRFPLALLLDADQCSGSCRFGNCADGLVRRIVRRVAIDARCVGNQAAGCAGSVVGRCSGSF